MFARDREEGEAFSFQFLVFSWGEAGRTVLQRSYRRCKRSATQAATSTENGQYGAKAGLLLRDLGQWIARKGKNMRLLCGNDPGTDVTDIVVESSNYERACDVAEAWAAELDAESRKRSKRRCPKCRSTRVDYVPHEKLDYVFRCNDCGCEFAV
jgi:hypothetical protein